MSVQAEEFELVVEEPVKAAPVKQTTVQERLAALLAESDDEESESDSDCGEVMGEEVYDEE
jgi:hypothetical protein